MSLALMVVALTCYSELNSSVFTEEHRLIMSVIRNRAIERELTVSEVCLQPRQFSWWNRYGSQPTVSTIQAEYVKIPASFIAGLTNAIEAACWFKNVNHFYSPKSMRPVGRVPAWAKNQQNYQTQNFKFYNIRRSK